jgi:hypothetical protein
MEAPLHSRAEPFGCGRRFTVDHRCTRMRIIQPSRTGDDKMSRIHTIRFIFGIAFILTASSVGDDNRLNKSDSTSASPVESRCKILPFVIQGKDSISTSISNMIHQNPYFLDQSGGVEYFMKVIKPDPDIDYKILVVRPDSSVDYKIMIVRPKSELRDIITENILNKYYQCHKNKNQIDQNGRRRR